MSTVNRLRLLALSDREFSREHQAPAPAPRNRKFRAVRLSLSKYDSSWDRRRGAAARLMAVLLREGDEELTERVCQDAKICSTYRGAVEWLTGEARLLRKHVERMETAASRLSVVLQRCGHTSPDAG